MLSLDDIDAILQGSAGHGHALQPQQWSGDDAADRAHRAQILQDVSDTLQNLVYSGSQEAELVSQKLGDASRNPSWRLPLGDSGILDFALGILAMDNISQPLKTHSLRLVGNCCADTNENRDRIIGSNGMTTLIKQLADDDVLPFVVSVLYNVMVDHEAAQAAASNAGLSLHLVELISGPRLDQCLNILGMVGMILEILVAQENEAVAAHSNTPCALLNLTLNPALAGELSESLTLTSVALAYLAFQNVQAEFVSAGNMPVLLAAFYNLTTVVEPATFSDEDLAAQAKQVRGTFVQLLSDICYLPAFTYIHPLGSPVLDTLQSWLLKLANPHMQAAACLCLGNVARSDEASVALVATYKIHTPVIAIVAAHLEVQQEGVAPQPPQDALLLHSALSLLKNLAIPPNNKPQLSALLQPSMLPRIWSMDPNSSIQTPHLHYISVSLARLLLSSTPQNVRLLCAPLSPDTLSPLHETTHLHRVLDLFLRADPESAAHTKTEAARAALAVVRVLHTTTVTPVLPEWDPNSSDGYVFRPDKPLLPPTSSPGRSRSPDAGVVSGSARLEKFYRQHGALPRALAFLVTQNKFSVLRSEAWFVFALMSRTREGGSLVVRILQVPGAWDALVTSVTGRPDAESEASKAAAGGSSDATGASGSTTGPALEGMTSPGDSTMGSIGAADGSGASGLGGGADAMTVVDGLGLEPQQADPHAAASMARVDRENGLVLVSDLMRHCAADLPASRRSALEAMIKEGGELVLEDRNSDSSEGSVKGKGVFGR